jgi:hypothetical protein
MSVQRTTDIYARYHRNLPRSNPHTNIPYFGLFSAASDCRPYHFVFLGLHPYKHLFCSSPSISFHRPTSRIALKRIERNSHFLCEQAAVLKAKHPTRMYNVFESSLLAFISMMKRSFENRLCSQERSDISSYSVAVGHVHESKTTNRSFYVEFFECCRNQN